MKQLLLIIIFFSISFFILPSSAQAIPAEPFPSLSPTPTTTPFPSLSPTPTTEPLPVTDTVCPNNGTVYPPNSSCYPLVKKFEDPLTYPLSCISAPTVTYKETYTDYAPPPQTRTVEVITDIKEAQLGFLGPDSGSKDTSNPDRLAQKYLFNALFDKPGVNQNSSKEAFRTFWRMLNNLSQAQLKAFYLENTSNHTFFYVGSDYKQHEVKLNELKNILPSCLKSYSKSDLFGCWKNSKYLSEYLKLNKTTREEYDAILPFDFNNLRSYIVLGTTISKENIPYLKAILGGLKGYPTSKETVPGLFDYYTPDWAVKPLVPRSSSPANTPLEDLQYPAIILRAATSSCPLPTKTSSVPSPKTYPSITSLTQTVTVNVTSKLIDTGTDSCSCPPGNTYCYWYVDCEQYSDNALTCTSNGCVFNPGPDTYELSGSAKGKHSTVFNNPYINNLTDLVVGSEGEVGLNSKTQPSFYKMLLPSYASTSAKIIVSAPTVNTTTNNKNAVVSGSSVIYRENNLAQDTMHLLQNCWLIPSEGQSSFKCGALKDALFECVGDCDPNIPSTDTALALKPTFIDLATRWLNTGTPRIDKFETVISQAVSAGVNPIFALTIWLNESNASNYAGVCEVLGGGDLSSGFCNRLLDFGINLDDIASNYATGDYHFEEQLAHFLQLPSFYVQTCKPQMEKYNCPMRIFMAMFLSGTCEPTAASDGYYRSIQSVFSWLAPNEKFPCYPIKYP